MTRALLLSFLLAGCATVADQAPPPQPPYALSPKEVEAVHAAVKRDLKDPFSAVFDPDIKASFRPGSTTAVVACGWVNAKNSFGGYIGRKPFMASIVIDPKAPPSPMVGVIGDGPVGMQDYIVKECRKAGVAFP